MKNIKYVVLGFMLFIMTLGRVDAASVGISSNSYSITKGGSVTVTATVSSESPVVSIEGTLMCKGAGASGGVDMAFDDSSNSIYSKSYSVTVKSSSSGSISCSVTGARITNMTNDSWVSLSDKSISITVNEPAVIKPKSYSSNNNLKSLEVEGYSLDKDFSKDKLEYNVEVPNGTEKVNIKGSLEDSTASISGNGEVSVSEGLNKLEVKVTAENGNVKTYIINVTVKELDPIEVTINKKKYTIIRKEGIIDPPLNYEKSSIKIGNDDILCYENKTTKNILIGLKDSNGNAKYYSYDKKTNSYTLYNGYVIGGVSLSIIDMPKKLIPSGYNKISFKYDNNKLDGYQRIQSGVTYAADENVRGSDFYLIYAVNENTGKKGIYVYDKLENTVQRYDDTISKSYKEKADSYFLYMIISISLFAVTFVTLLIVLIKKKKHKSRFA